MRTIFGFRDRLIDEYSEFSRSFTRIRAADIEKIVSDEYAKGRYWHEPLIQINPHYERKGTIPQLVTQGLLHRLCGDLSDRQAGGKTRPLPGATIGALRCRALSGLQCLTSLAILQTSFGSGYE